MYRYEIDDIAQAELDGVGGVYISYFARLGDSGRGREWANRFYTVGADSFVVWHIRSSKSDFSTVRMM